jgi:antitoxin (DNA-binding transcriptional repressor) of toxin-antitoxin stability system
MTTRITPAELAEHLADVLHRVRYRGERFVIERNGESVAELTPAGPRPGPTPRELAARLGDLPLPGDGFADDLEFIQASQPAADLPEWPN